jgi:hypothetical protein
MPLDADRAWASLAVWDLAEAHLDGDAARAAQVRIVFGEALKGLHGARRVPVLLDMLARAVGALVVVDAHYLEQTPDEVCARLREAAEALIDGRIPLDPGPAA